MLYHTISYSTIRCWRWTPLRAYLAGWVGGDGCFGFGVRKAEALLWRKCNACMCMYESVCVYLCVSTYVYVDIFYMFDVFCIIYIYIHISYMMVYISWYENHSVVTLDSEQAVPH